MSPAGRGASGTHGQITLTVVVQRKQPNLPRYLLVPTARLAGWHVTETIVVDVALDDNTIGRRTLKRWDARRWFVELPDRSCRRVGIDVGQRVTLTMRRASTEMPHELAELVQRDPQARIAWSALSESRRRMLQEEVRSGARPETRTRRARCGLRVEVLAQPGGAA